MQKVICDKCGITTDKKFTDGWQIEPYHNYVHTMFYHIDYHGSDYHGLDLCPDCYKSYQEIIVGADNSQKALVKEFLGEH